LRLSAGWEAAGDLDPGWLICLGQESWDEGLESRVLIQDLAYLDTLDGDGGVPAPAAPLRLEQPFQEMRKQHFEPILKLPALAFPQVFYLLGQVLPASFGTRCSMSARACSNAQL
jgi:hypothetical protein